MFYIITGIILLLTHIVFLCINIATARKSNDFKGRVSLNILGIIMSILIIVPHLV